MLHGKIIRHNRNHNEEGKRIRRYLIRCDAQLNKEESTETTKDKRIINNRRQNEPGETIRRLIKRNEQQKKE